jgi:hypothetical protein
MPYSNYPMSSYNSDYFPPSQYHPSCETDGNKRQKVDSANVVTEREISMFAKSGDFIIDSGCTSHMCSNLDLFDEYQLSQDEDLVELADGSVVEITARGRVGPFSGVSYIPQLTKNLISVSQLDREGYSILFEDGKVTLVERLGGKRIEFGILKDRLYSLNGSEFAGGVSERIKDVNLWHQRLAHLNHRDVIQLANSGAVDGMNMHARKNAQCDA